MKGKVSTGAIVTVTLQIELGDRWGEDCKLDQVFKQAEDGARDAVRKLCEESHGRIRLLNVAQVRATTWKEES